MEYPHSVFECECVQETAEYRDRYALRSWPTGVTASQLSLSSLFVSASTAASHISKWCITTFEAWVVEFEARSSCKLLHEIEHSDTTEELHEERAALLLELDELIKEGALQDAKFLEACKLRIAVWQNEDAERKAILASVNMMVDDQFTKMVLQHKPHRSARTTLQ